MSLWNVLLQFLDGESTLLTADIVVWNNQIDAKGFPGTLLREPLEGPVQFLRLHASRTKQAKAASFSHRKNNRRTMAECKKWDIHAVGVAEGIMHPIPPGEFPPLNDIRWKRRSLRGGVIWPT